MSALEEIKKNFIFDAADLVADYEEMLDKYGRMSFTKWIGDERFKLFNRAEKAEYKYEFMYVAQHYAELKAEM